MVYLLLFRPRRWSFWWASSIRYCKVYVYREHSVPYLDDADSSQVQGLGGYAGWRWLLIIEGLATVVFAIIAKFTIPDWPEDAKFLDATEKALLARRLANDGTSGVARMDRLDRQTCLRILMDWKIWTACVPPFLTPPVLANLRRTFMYMGVTVSGYSTAFFIPTILNEFGYTSSASQLLTIPIYAVCTVVTLLTAWLSDRLRHRYIFTIGGVFIATIGYILLLAQGQPKGPGALSIGVRYLAVFFITTGTYITQPLTIVWLSNNMGGHYKRAFGSAIQIGVGNIGGIIGSTIYLQNESPRFHTGYSVGLGMMWLCGVMCTVFWVHLMRENRRRERGERDGRLRLPKEVVENLGDDHPEFRFTG